MLDSLRSRFQRKENTRTDRERAAVFSVIVPGGTHLRVLVVEVMAGQAQIWGWAESDDWPGTEPEYDGWLAACEDLLSQAEEMARDRAGRLMLPDQMMVGFAASQIRGRAWSVVQSRSRPDRPVEERELSALLGRALRLAVNRLWSGLPEQRQSREPEWVLLDALPVAMSVDGRGVTDPIGFRGRELGATVFAALSPIKTIHTWQTIARHLEFSALTLTAAPVALAAAQQQTEGILFDVGGTVTDLTWWRNGRPFAVASVDMGGEMLTHALRDKWRLTTERAEGLKQSYAGGHLDSEADAHIQEVIYPLLRNWLDEVEDTLVLLLEAADGPLPQQLSLAGGGSTLPEIAQSVGALAWSERLRFDRYPQVRDVRPTDVAGVVNRTDLGNGPGDVAALALAAWTARLVNNRSRPVQILSELCSE